jgi:hypothetical protein
VNIGVNYCCFLCFRTLVSFLFSSQCGQVAGSTAVNASQVMLQEVTPREVLGSVNGHYRCHFRSAISCLTLCSF